MKSDIAPLERHNRRNRGGNEKLPSHADVTEKIEMIGPDQARAYLGRNISPNRNLQMRVVDRYARDMAEGNWRPIGDPIRLDDEGNLIDGQHRLKAIEMANVTLPFHVVRGLHPQDVHVIDTGKARTPADMLKIDGYANTAVLAGACRVLLTLKEGTEFKYGRSYSHSQLREIAEKHPLLLESTYTMKPVLRGLAPSAVAAIHYIAAHFLDQREKADAFVQVLATGIPSRPDDPAHFFRERIIERRDKHTRFTNLYRLRELIHVWNKYANGETIRQLKVPDVVNIHGFDLDLI